MMLKINKKLPTLLVLMFFFAFYLPSFCQGAVFGGPPDGDKPIDVELLLLNTLVFVVWPAAVTVVIIFFIMAGFKFLTAQGKPEELATARGWLMWAVGGVIVILLAFSIIETIELTFKLF